MEGLRRCDVTFSQTFVGGHLGLWGGQAYSGTCHTTIYLISLSMPVSVMLLMLRGLIGKGPFCLLEYVFLIYTS